MRKASKHDVLIAKCRACRRPLNSEGVCPREALRDTDRWTLMDDDEHDRGLVHTNSPSGAPVPAVDPSRSIPNESSARSAAEQTKEAREMVDAVDRNAERRRQQAELE